MQTTKIEQVTANSEQQMIGLKDSASILENNWQWKTCNKKTNKW